MKVIVSGSSGLIGSALLPHLQQRGHEAIRLVRRETAYGEIRWYPDKGLLQGNFLGEPDAMVHLGGENIAEGRWTAAKKKRIRDSRVKTTELIAKTIAELDKKPKVFVTASAIGYYGNRGDEQLTESSAPGSGFLSEVCQEWEAATIPAQEAGIRVVNMRIGVVLSRHAGALSKMLPIFRIGFGGVVGNGRQYWSCVSLGELVEMLACAVEDEQLTGPVNAVSVAVTNREFTTTLGRIIKRPTLIPLPAFAARLILGEMGNELMLSSTHVVSEKLRASGYSFKNDDIESALTSALSESSA
jgi:uncharacterized protein (TIGR01777 family)